MCVSCCMNNGIKNISDFRNYLDSFFEKLVICPVRMFFRWKKISYNTEENMVMIYILCCFREMGKASQNEFYIACNFCSVAWKNAIGYHVIIIIFP